MKKMYAAFLALVPLLTVSSVAQAQNARVFVAAKTGNDANTCNDVTTPCKTFAGAITQVAAGGEVIVTESGGYGLVVIAKSLTINAPPGVLAFIHAPSGDAVTVNAPGATVVLRGLTIDGAAGYGVYGQAFSVLHIENCVINGTSNAGINVSSAGRVFLVDTVVRNTGWIGVGLAAASGSVTAVIDHCLVENNFDKGFAIGGNGIVTIRDTLSTGNGNYGFFIYSNVTTTIDATLENCVASNNVTHGVLADGPGTTVRVSNCTVTDNVGFGLYNFDGATFLTRQNNTVAGNFSGPTNGTIVPFSPI